MFTLTLRSRPVLLSVAAALSFTLGGCGGGGGGHVASIPPPAPPPPPPPPPQGVAIFGDPQPGTYATVGASAAGLGGYVKSEDPIGPISTASGDQPHIRYTTDGHYEVLLPGAGWEQLGAIWSEHFAGCADGRFQSDHPAGRLEARQLSIFGTLNLEFARRSLRHVRLRGANSGRRGTGDGVGKLPRRRHRPKRRLPL